MMDVPDPRSIMVGGKRWRLMFEDLGKTYNGLCDSPDTPNKAIHIHRALLKKPQDLLRTALHEGMHAQGWHIDEGYIEKASEDLARMLWLLGYRRIQE